MLRPNDPRQLWRRYALALSVVLALLVTSHVASLRALSGGEEAAAAINISGRQGMLSQRILYLSAETLARGEVDPRLEQAIVLFERSHRALSQGGDLGLSREGAADRTAVYRDVVAGTSLELATMGFIKDARLVLSGEGALRDAAWERMRFIGPGVLLTRLDEAVKAFERAAQEQTQATERIAHATFALALAVLAAEALLIFWPAQRLVARALDGLRCTNAALSRSHRRMTDLLEDARTARQEAERAMGVRAQFLANMSHELRTPLNGILGMLQLIEDDPAGADPARRARTARTSAEHLLALLNSMLDLSRIESGGVAAEAVPLDPRALGADALAAVEAAAARKGLALRYEPGASLPERVLGDPARLTQVIAHLLGNAVTFTEAGAVTLAMRHDASRLRVEVRDTGIGIAPEAQERLFERFEQADASTTRRHGGAGLGLWVSRRLVTLMGGAIGVSSALGEGSAFWLEVPAPLAAAAAPDPAPAEASADPPEKRPAPRRLRVLVAEDNAVNRQVIMAFVRGLGHDVRCVPDGAAAVAAVADAIGSCGLDVVLMDIHMPVMDGVTAARAIRARGPDTDAIAILAVTADTLEPERYAAAGIDGCVPKPIRRAELTEAIADALWRRASPGAGGRTAAA